MKIALTTLLLVLVLALTGCGGDEDPLTSAGAEPSKQGWLNRGTKLVTIRVDGTEMLCIERAGHRGGQYDSGVYSGLTCDWYGWHRKRDAP